MLETSPIFRSFPKGQKVKKTKDEIRALIREADTLFSRYIHMRDKKSLYSGQAGCLHCCHLVNRGSYRYRWNPQNAMSLTANEHLNGWHGKDGEKYKDWLRVAYPDIYNFYQQALSDSFVDAGKRPSTQELKSIVADLRQLLKTVQ